MGVAQETTLFDASGKESQIMKVKVLLDASKVLNSQLKIAGLDKKDMEVVTSLISCHAKLPQ